jgi:MFS family permease
MNLVDAYRGLLGNRNLVRLLAGEFISSIGDWLYLVALLIVVYQESSDPVLLGIVGAARVLPYVFLSIPAGIVADRFDRRLILMSTDLARGVIMLALAWLVATDGPLWAVVALAILATCFSSFFGPTIGAYLPSLVKDESQLGPANSAWSSLDNLAFIIGPAIGGLLIAGSGLTLAFILNAVSFAVCAAILIGLPSIKPGQESHVGDAEASSEPSVDAAATASARRVLGTIARPLGGLIVIDVVGAFVFGGLSILTVVLATDVLGAGEAGTGYLNAAIGVGGVVGAIGAGALVLRPSLGPPLLVGSIGFGLGVIVLGAVDAFAVALIAMAVTAAADLVLEVVETTLFQRIVPDAIRGRTLGITETATMVAYAAGSLVIPIAAGSLGIPIVLVAGGIAISGAGMIAVVIIGAGHLRTEAPVAATVRRVARLPIFAGVPPPRLERAVRQLTTVPVMAGAVVIRQGDPADRFYVISDGTFEVTRRESITEPPRMLRQMGPDEVFGEIGLLTEAPRTATVIALTDGVLLALDGSDFLELVSAGPGLANRLLDLHRGVSTPVARVSGGSWGEVSGT